MHFSPILFLAMPFVKIFEGARGLIILQSLLTAATIFPLWGIAVSRFPRWLAYAVTLIAALYPVLGAEAVGTFTSSPLHLRSRQRWFGRSIASRGGSLLLRPPS